MLITPEYQKQQERMHGNKSLRYGVVAERYGEMVGQIIDQMELNSLLDYGCGRRLSLQKNLKPERAIKYQAYDPGVPEYSGEPSPAELVCCIDVLEHIEPECIIDVLDHLEDLTEMVLFATVHTGPAGKNLPDGRNAHLIQQPMEWWLPKFTERWGLYSVQRRGSQGFEVIAYNPEVFNDIGERPVNKILDRKGNGSDKEA